ncbi:MAG: DUF2807 domain-containing protein [Maribacter sp.]|uniref:GIN domain-containing protein n=1 Tax=Maribacter sp. TaxID=1897614 RepID=UPI0032977B21
MKKVNLLLAVLLLTVSSTIGQHKETLNTTEYFDNVKLDGNVRLYLKQGSAPIVGVETRNERNMDEYRIAIRNNTLYVQHRARHGSAPKIEVYLTHPELKSIDMDGLVYAYSSDPVTSKSFSVKGDGLIRGEIEVDVQELNVDLDGLCSMSFYGKADETDLRLDGMGKINARDLVTSEVKKSADGLAIIRVTNIN